MAVLSRSTSTTQPASRSASPLTTSRGPPSPHPARPTVPAFPSLAAGRLSPLRCPLPAAPGRDVYWFVHAAHCTGAGCATCSPPARRRLHSITVRSRVTQPTNVRCRQGSVLRVLRAVQGLEDPEGRPRCDPDCGPRRPVVSHSTLPAVLDDAHNCSACFRRCGARRRCLPRRSAAVHSCARLPPRVEAAAACSDTGNEIYKTPLDKRLFAEGCDIKDGVLKMLTWREDEMLQARRPSENRRSPPPAARRALVSRAAVDAAVDALRDSCLTPRDSQWFIWLQLPE